MTRALDRRPYIDRRPLLDELLADWHEPRIGWDGRTVTLLPDRDPPDHSVFTVVLPLTVDSPDSLAPARLWAAALPLARCGSGTLREQLEDAGGELTVRAAAGAAVLTGGCPRRDLPATLDAVRHAVHDPDPAPDRLPALAGQLAEQHLIGRTGVEVRARALARRAAFGPAAPLPPVDYPTRLLATTAADLGAYRARHTDPGWLVVDAGVTTDWPGPDSPAADEPGTDGPEAGEPTPPRRPGPVPPATVIRPDPGRPVGAAAFAARTAPAASTAYWRTALASTVLGGYFSARLWERLRAGDGRVYDPRSVVEHTAAGPCVLVTAATPAAHLPATVRAVREELAGLCRAGIEPTELRRAQHHLLGGLLRDASGRRRLAALVATWLARGVHPARLIASGAAIHRTTADDVLAAARKDLSPDAVSLAVYGAHAGHGATEFDDPGGKT